MDYNKLFKENRERRKKEYGKDRFTMVEYLEIIEKECGKLSSRKNTILT